MDGWMKMRSLNVGMILGMNWRKYDGNCPDIFKGSDVNVLAWGNRKYPFQLNLQSTYNSTLYMSIVPILNISNNPSEEIGIIGYFRKAH
jgi:hypothetical protein